MPDQTYPAYRVPFTVFYSWTLPSGETLTFSHRDHGPVFGSLADAERFAAAMPDADVVGFYPCVHGC